MRGMWSCCGKGEGGRALINGWYTLLAGMDKWEIYQIDLNPPWNNEI